MYETKENRKPRAPFYVSLHNGAVYPAQRGLPGYEDDNPGDWRIANSLEVEAYKRGDKPAPQVGDGDVNLTAPVTQRAAPGTITLAEDDPVVASEPALPIAAAPVAGVDPPLAPFIATPPPAFNL